MPCPTILNARCAQGQLVTRVSQNCATSSEILNAGSSWRLTAGGTTTEVFILITAILVLGTVWLIWSVMGRMG